MRRSARATGIFQLPTEENQACGHQVPQTQVAPEPGTPLSPLLCGSKIGTPNGTLSGNMDQHLRSLVV